MDKTKEEMLYFVSNVIDSDIDKAYRLVNYLLAQLSHDELKKIYDVFYKN